MSMKAVVLAAGKGTRMMPLTKLRPKPLVPVAGRPIIDHIISGLAAGGFTKIGLVVGYMEEMLRERIGDGRRLGAESVEYIVQDEAKGTGHATLLAADFVGDDPFFLGWGDIIVPPGSYREIGEIYRTEKPQAILSVNHVDDPWEGAAVYVSEDGFVERIVEKPPKGTATTNYNNAGLFVFGPELMEILRNTPPSERGEIEVPSAIDQMLGSGARIRGYVIDGYWSDVARPSTSLWISGQMIELASRDGVILHPDARVAGATELVAPVRIGAGVRVAGGRIGPNVVLMEGAEIGAAARLADVCVFPGGSVGGGAQLQHVVVEEGVSVPEEADVKGTVDEAAIVEG